MRITKRLLFLSFAVLLIKSSHSQISSPDTMVHRIFTSLKNKDEKAFVALFPNQEQMTKMMSKLMAGLVTEIAKMDTTNKKEIKQDDLNEMMLEQMKSKTKPEELTKEYERFGKNFRNIIKAGEQRGIDWKSITLLKYTYDTIAMKDEMAVKLFGTDGIKSMKGQLFFTSADTTYQLSFKETMYLPEEGGWYGAELYRLRTENEKLTDDVEIKEVTIESMSDEPPPPPPPPPAKSKTKTKLKTPASKTKTKT